MNDHGVHKRRNDQQHGVRPRPVDAGVFPDPALRQLVQHLGDAEQLRESLRTPRVNARTTMNASATYTSHAIKMMAQAEA